MEREDMRGSSATLLLDNLGSFVKTADDVYILEREHVWRVLVWDTPTPDPDDELTYFILWRDNHPVDLYDDEDGALNAICQGEGIDLLPDDLYRGLRV
jgi:hypothetical protein